MHKKSRVPKTPDQITTSQQEPLGRDCRLRPASCLRAQRLLLQSGDREICTEDERRPFVRL
jgi:hypothetical protein